MAGRPDASAIIINIFDSHPTEKWHGGELFLTATQKSYPEKNPELKIL